MSGRAVLACLAGALLVFALSAGATAEAVPALSASAPSVAREAPVVPVTAPLAAQQPTPDPGSGPVIDPSENSKANADKARNKIVVGVAAVLLALIVLWGRRVRGKKQKKTDAQAKGK